MAIEILSAGPLTTVQDRGRFGYQKSGIRACGVMDTDAYEAACRLCGLPFGERDGAAVLEMTLYGASIRFTEDSLFALTGADMQPVLDGVPCPSYEAVRVRAGGVLSLGAARCGCRAYFAAAGGIAVPPVMGSRSTDVKASIGGLVGRALKPGDILPLGEHEELSFIYDASGKYKISRPSYGRLVRVRAIPGPQDDMFTAKGLKTFFSSVYTIAPDSDRMGCRLQGPAVESIRGTDIISDGIAFGSVQVSASGLPIVLMADRQTTGGYAKIAAVCSADLPLLAQCRPGDRVQFIKTDIRHLR